MWSVRTLYILLIVGGAAALPQLDGSPGRDSSSDNNNDVDTTATVLETVSAYITATYDGGDTASTTLTAVAEPSSILAPSSGPAEASATPSATSSATVASSDSDSATGYMEIVNTWRAKLGLKDLVQSDTLQANALKTAQDGNGQMVHELNPGSFAQVLAPGSTSEFEKVFVGGWLCERPDLPGLDGVCTTMSEGWAYDGQTGHADILVSDAYSTIGCAQAVGIWGCDLA